MRARCQATPDSDVRAWRCSLLSSGTYQGPLIELGLNLVIVSCTLKTVRVGVAALSLHKRPVGTRVCATRSALPSACSTTCSRLRVKSASAKRTRTCAALGLRACRRVPPASALAPILPQVQFYARKIQSRPQGAFVDVMHATWDGQWERLERLHGYIQWLFPVFENAGMNWESSPLTKEGARQIRESEVMSRRVLASYRLMLRFFGLRLVDERTGAALFPP